jgi:hypothetical protein
VDAEGAAGTQVNLIAIVLEDLFLGKLLLELEGDDHLGQLAGPAFFLVEEKLAGKLHAESGGALVFAAFLKVDPGGADHAEGVEAGVGEEAFVFGGGDGLNQHLGNIAEVDHAALFAVGAGHVGDELRLELVLIALGVVFERDDLGDAAARETDDSGFLVEIRFGTREDGDGVELHRVVTDGVATRFVIAAAAQFGGDFGGGSGISDGHGFGSSEDFGGIGEGAFAQFTIDNVGILPIEVSKSSAGQHRATQKREDEHTPGGSQEKTGQKGITGYPDPHFPFWCVLNHQAQFSHEPGTPRSRGEVRYKKGPLPRSVSGATVRPDVGELRGGTGYCSRRACRSRNPAMSSVR